MYKVNLNREHMWRESYVQSKATALLEFRAKFAAIYRLHLSQPLNQEVCWVHKGESFS